MGIVNAIWILNVFPILVNVRTYAKFSLREPSQMVCNKLLQSRRPVLDQVSYTYYSMKISWHTK